MYRNQDIAQPDDLKEILELRPEGARHPAEKPSDLYNRMKGALIGRFAGCVLGIPVEMYSVARMQALALDCGMNYPPDTFWTGTDNPEKIHYQVNKRTDYLIENIDKVPVDDDITYTILNLLLLEKYGKNYTVDDVAELWLDILPYACTGATVGSIVGACIGFDKIPAHWYDRFNDTVCTYLKGNTTLSIEDVVKRFIGLNG